MKVEEQLLSEIGRPLMSTVISDRMEGPWWHRSHCFDRKRDLKNVGYKEFAGNKKETKKLVVTGYFYC